MASSSTSQPRTFSASFLNANLVSSPFHSDIDISAIIPASRRRTQASSSCAESSRCSLLAPATTSSKTGPNSDLVARIPSRTSSMCARPNCRRCGPDSSERVDEISMAYVGPLESKCYLMRRQSTNALNRTTINVPHTADAPARGQANDWNFVDWKRSRGAHHDERTRTGDVVDTPDGGVQGVNRIAFAGSVSTPPRSRVASLGRAGDGCQLKRKRTPYPRGPHGTNLTPPLSVRADDAPDNHAGHRKSHNPEIDETSHKLSLQLTEERFYTGMVDTTLDDDVAAQPKHTRSPVSSPSWSFRSKTKAKLTMVGKAVEHWLHLSKSRAMIGSGRTYHRYERIGSVFGSDAHPQKLEADPKQTIERRGRNNVPNPHEVMLYETDSDEEAAQTQGLSRMEARTREESPYGDRQDAFDKRFDRVLVDELDIKNRMKVLRS